MQQSRKSVENQRQAGARQRRLLWLYAESPENTLDAATWLETSRELNALSWDVTLLAEGAAPGWTTIQGSNVFLIKRPDVYLLGQLVFHWRALRFYWRSRVPFDVILFHEMSAILFVWLRLLRPFGRGRAPLFVLDTRTLHMTREDKQGVKDKFRRLFYTAVNRTAGYWVDGRLAITQRLAEAMKIPVNQLWGTWPSGVARDRFIDAAAARTFPTGDQPVRVIYVGSMNYERNLMALARAVAAAVEQGAMSFELCLVGNGTEWRDLAAFSRDKSYIELTPAVPHVEVPNVLARAHVGVLPFPDEEKFRVSSPIKLFEYMASGLPIMATRIDCHTDVIVARAGQPSFTYWVEGADESALLQTLHQVWATRNTLADRGKAATDHSLQWTWRQSALKLSTALERGIHRTGSLPVDRQ